MADHSSPKIVIVGAGLAGMTTAYRLNESGLNVELYEARNRLGGRVFSVKLGEHSAELGGQNILNGGDADHILSLIDELDLEVNTAKNLYHLRYFDGNQIIDPQERLKTYGFTPENLKEKLEDICLTARNLKDILVSLFRDDEILIQTFSVQLAAYEGIPPERLSIQDIETLYYLLLGGLSSAHQSHGEEDVYIDHLWVKGGNSKIIEKLAEKLENKIHTNTVLTSISKDKYGKYHLTFKNGEQVSADIVVLTMPCTVYSDIKIHDDVIPHEKQLAIQAIQYGTNSKILVPVNPSDNAHGSFTNGRMISFFPGHYRAVTMYYVGEYGCFTPNTLEDTFHIDLKLMERVYNLATTNKEPVTAIDQLFATYSGPVGHSWPNDPFAKGSYSSIAAGQEDLFTSLEDWDDEQVKVLFTPIENRLFFAGEHTSILLDVDGTMEAAVESGERTARMIIKSMNSD